MNIWPITDVRVDHVIDHKKRYERPNISDSGKRLSPIITNELGRKFYCAKKTVYWNDIHIFGRGSFYEERRQSEVYDKKLSTSERTTSFQNGSYSVSIKEGKVIKIKNKLVRLIKNIWCF